MAETRIFLTRIFKSRVRLLHSASIPITDRDSDNEPLIYPYGSRSLSAQVAAVRSLCPAPDFPSGPHRRSLSTPFECQELAPNGVSQRPHSIHILKSPWKGHESSKVALNQQNHLSRKQSTGQLSTAFPDKVQRHAANESLDARLFPGSDAQSITPNRSPPVLQVSKITSASMRPSSISSSPIFAYEERRSSLSRKPDIRNLRNASHQDHVRSFSVPVVNSENLRPRHTPRSPITRAQLDKPLPPIPLEIGATSWPRSTMKDVSWLESTSELSLSPRAQAAPADNQGCERTVDTTLYQRWSPAVTHEMITRLVHNIREEHTTRNIHNHHVYHRTLPVVDVELRPARHFIPSEEGLIEVAEDDVPVDMRLSEDWLTAQVTSRLFSDNGLDELNDSGSRSTLGFLETDVEDHVNLDGTRRIESIHTHPTHFGQAIVGSEQSYAVRINVDD